MTQNAAVIETIDRLGGIATLGDLYHEVFKIEDCKWNTKTPFASIRRIVQTTPGIYKIKPGLYGLEKYKRQNEERGAVVETEKNQDSAAVANFNHSYYQGILLLIGDMHHLSTYLPNQDKNKLYYDGRRLGELSTLPNVPPFSYPRFVDRCKTIDVIWFNERKMPYSLFEVEHSTDIQNSLLKFYDLQDFNTRMTIVADKRREQEFNAKISYGAFKDLKEAHRVTFLTYDNLIDQYHLELKRQSLSVII